MPASPHQRERGVVAWFHAARGYGFITSLVDDAPVFVSHRDLEGDDRFRTLDAGDHVDFARAIDEHGPVAVDVVRAVAPAAGSRTAHPAA